MCPILEMSALIDAKSLKPILSSFSYCKMGGKFFGRNLVSQSYKEFSLSPEALKKVLKLRTEIVESSPFHAIDENRLFVDECYASEVAICCIFVTHFPR